MWTDEKMIISKFLSSIRKECRLTQAEIAELLEVSRTTYQYHEINGSIDLIFMRELVEKVYKNNLTLSEFVKKYELFFKKESSKIK